MVPFTSDRYYYLPVVRVISLCQVSVAHHATVKCTVLGKYVYSNPPSLACRHSVRQAKCQCASLFCRVLVSGLADRFVPGLHSRPRNSNTPVTTHAVVNVFLTPHPGRFQRTPPPPHTSWHWQQVCGSSLTLALVGGHPNACVWPDNHK